MIHCSLPQALAVWSELEQARAGNNKYGGHTAEIYAYRLEEHFPSLMVQSTGPIAMETKLEAAQNASSALRELLRHFAATRNATIRVDGVALSRWKAPPEEHRWHVEVHPKKR